MLVILAFGVENTGSMQNASSLVNLDWTPANLLTLKRTLHVAYNDVEAMCDPNKHPMFATPNRPFGTGYNRWLAVDAYLNQACQDGKFVGISAHWIPLGGKGGLHVLELRGAYTSVLSVHLADVDETPRDSDYRYDKRVSNEKYPMLEGFELPEETPGQLLNLLLVHGDKNAEFAFLRAYDDPKNRASFTEFTQNIMLGTPFTTEHDTESVPEPTIALIAGTSTQTKPATGT